MYGKVLGMRGRTAVTYDSMNSYIVSTSGRASDDNGRRSCKVYVSIAVRQADVYEQTSDQPGLMLFHPRRQFYTIRNLSSPFHKLLETGKIETMCKQFITDFSIACVEI